MSRRAGCYWQNPTSDEAEIKEKVAIFIKVKTQRTPESTQLFLLYTWTSTQESCWRAAEMVRCKGPTIQKLLWGHWVKTRLNKPRGHGLSGAKMAYCILV